MRKEERRFWKTNFPKLDIIMFDSAHFDWFRFWNQFESQIDKFDLPQASNFSYLKELIIPKIHLLVDSLPFTSEGCARAKNILMTKYVKPSKVANAHV